MRGKWRLHHYYLKDSTIARYLPDTAIFNRTTLQQFLSRYMEIYVKPNLEHMGKGIIKVWKQNQQYAYVKVSGKLTFVSSLNLLYKRLSALTGTQSYLVQKGIPLAKLAGRSYDIRVMMMRGGSNEWQYAGMLAKVAGPGSVITNINRGKGYVTTVRRALTRSLNLNQQQVDQVENTLIRLSHRICERFRGIKYSSQIGIDFGIDQQQKIWVIEINFDYPSHELFNKMSDKSYYRRIKYLKRMYQRR
ncbi:MAG: hypothetical protein A2189_04625 [Paenibacillus sp. RIFOXYA1_FULL_44_5]|nr:MAG: hypothetical protein A2189_04625 [Paenibacillus sp. RIFOXYA1_FULL_44_5]